MVNLAASLKSTALDTQPNGNRLECILSASVKKYLHAMACDAKLNAISIGQSIFVHLPSTTYFSPSGITVKPQVMQPALALLKVTPTSRQINENHPTKICVDMF